MEGTDNTTIPGLSPAAPWFAARKSRLRTAAKGFFLLLAAWYFAFCDASNPMFLKMDQYTQGLSRTPYQYRELMMYVFRGLIRIHAITSVAQHLNALDHDPYKIIFALISFVAILGAFAATRLTLIRLTRDPAYAFWASFLVILMAHLLLASTWGPSLPLPYDVPSLCFFAVAIYLIITGRRLLFSLLFVIATFNRETTCFLTIFFALWEWVRLTHLGSSLRARLIRIAPVVIFQAVIWIAIKIYLSHKYIHNPTEIGMASGSIFHTMLSYNLHEFAKPWQWPKLAGVCAFTLPFVFLQRRWIRCDALRIATGAVIALSLLGLLIVGVIDEVRIFTEWIAMVVPCLALIVHNRFRPVETTTG